MCHKAFRLFVILGVLGALACSTAHAQYPAHALLVLAQAEEAAEETPEPEPEEPKAEVPKELSSARRSMRTFITAIEKDDYFTAAGAVDMSQLPESVTAMEKVTRMRRLKDVIDRLAFVDYAAISDDPEGATFRFPPGEVNQPIVIARGEDGVWRVTAETVDKVPTMYEAVKNQPVIKQPTSWYTRKLLLDNEVWRILALVGSIFIGLVLGQLCRYVMIKVGQFFERRKRPVVAVTCATIGRFSAPAIFLMGLGGGLQFLVLEHGVQTFTQTIVRVLFTLVIAYAAYRLVDVAIESMRELARRTGGTLNDMVVPVVGTSLRLTVVVLALLEILTYLSDKPPSSVIAGLGIGGLAIGLAAQDTLKNFFGSVAVYLDRPFELGDRIVIDGHDGPVEAVGFRSTRIRTLDGHLVTVPNGELAFKTIQNIGKRPFIRRVMDLRIALDTPPEKIEQALSILRELLDQHEGMEEAYPPRVFLHEFLDTAITMRVIYWYHPPAYWDFVAFGERINLEIVKRFDAEGIRFALPAQKLYLAGDADRSLPG
jgi:MscS family membrane protein